MQTLVFSANRFERRENQIFYCLIFCIFRALSHLACGVGGCFGPREIGLQGGLSALLQGVQGWHRGPARLHVALHQACVERLHFRPREKRRHEPGPSRSRQGAENASEASDGQTHDDEEAHRHQNHVAQEALSIRRLPDPAVTSCSEASLAGLATGRTAAPQTLASRRIGPVSARHSGR